MRRVLFPGLYLGLGFAQAAHSIEEVLAGLWNWQPAAPGGLLSYFADLPLFNVSGGQFAAANIAIVALVIGLSPFVYLNKPWAWKVACVVAVCETINGSLHLAGALLNRGYFPGCLSGIALLALGIPLWAVPSIRRIPSGTD